MCAWLRDIASIARRGLACVSPPPRLPEPYDHAKFSGQLVVIAMLLPQAPGALRGVAEFHDSVQQFGSRV